MVEIDRFFDEMDDEKQTGDSWLRNHTGFTSIPASKKKKYKKKKQKFKRTKKILKNEKKQKKKQTTGIRVLVQPYLIFAEATRSQWLKSILVSSVVIGWLHTGGTNISSFLRKFLRKVKISDLRKIETEHPGILKLPSMGLVGVSWNRGRHIFALRCDWLNHPRGTG